MYLYNSDWRTTGAINLMEIDERNMGEFRQSKEKGEIVILNNKKII